jgi:hypothetical protein
MEPNGMDDTGRVHWTLAGNARDPATTVSSGGVGWEGFIGNGGTQTAGVSWPDNQVTVAKSILKLAMPPDTDAKRMAWAVIEGDDNTAFVLADSILIDKARPEGTETLAEENARLRAILSGVRDGMKALNSDIEIAAEDGGEWYGYDAMTEMVSDINRTLNPVKEE